MIRFFISLVSFGFLLLALDIISYASTARIENGTRLFVDGKPFFPIGIYYLPKSENPYAELAEAGFNLVRSDLSEEQLNAADAQGLKVWISLGHRLDFSEDSEKRKRDLETQVNQFKSHPALLAWESIDEPAWTWKKPAEARVSAENLAAGHEYLKKLDANHLLWINHAPRNTCKTLQKFSAHTDAVACDIYPVIPRNIDADKTYALMSNGKQGDLANQSLSCVGEYVHKMKKVADSKKATWIVLQGFAWNHDTNPDNPLFPTPEETRFMAYDAVINGVEGILYWGTHVMPQPSPQWDGIKRVAKELSALTPVLLAPTIQHNISIDYEEMGFSIDKGIEILAKYHDNKVYLIMANTTIGPVKATFSQLLNIYTDTLNVLFENRKVTITSGTFVDEFKPYGVHVYCTP
ncbi:hypothetical protein FJZ31_20145 [Candidatus Poribacteria bacterium]|nr:hypothetical protein [Candidatus Poribacteria bacterium]